MNATITRLIANMNEHGGALMIVNGRKCSFSSVRSYTAYCNLTSGPQYQEDVEQAVQRAIDRNHDLYWINLESLVISGDAGYYDRQAAKWANAPRLSTGDVVEFEDKQFVIKPTHNNNFMPVAI